MAANVAALQKKACESSWFTSDGDELLELCLFVGLAEKGGQLSLDTKKSLSGFRSLEKELKPWFGPNSFELALAAGNVALALNVLKALSDALGAQRTGRNQYDLRQSTVFSIVGVRAEAEAVHSLVLEIAEQAAQHSAAGIKLRAEAALLSSQKLFGSLARLLAEVPSRESVGNGLESLSAIIAAGSEINRQIYSSKSENRSFCESIATDIGLE